MRHTSATTSDADVAVRDVAQRAGRQAGALGGDIWARVAASIPEAAGWKPAINEFGPASAEANIRELAAYLSRAPEPDAMRAPVLALAHARQFARDDVPLAALLRIYQLGHEVWRDFYVKVLGEQLRTSEEIVEAAGIVSAMTFAYLHATSAEVIAAYEQEHVRARESGERGRREVVDALLAGEAVDRATVTLRLGLDLDRAHTALVAWALPEPLAADPVPALEQLVRDAAALAGVERPLMLASGPTTVHAWLSRVREPGEPTLPSLLASSALETGAMALACGCEARGVAGFRSSHREALAARAFGAPGATPRELVAYADVELASLLRCEPDRARSFVRRELGGLAAPGEAARRLRDTLTAYLAATSSATRTAERLGVHKNTVVYRVRQAEEARGTPLGDRRLELEAALRLAAAWPAVLEDRAPSPRQVGELPGA